MTALVTYKNDPDFKAAFLAQIGQHEAADQLVKGTYGRTNGVFRGCAIGCSIRSLNLLSGKPHDLETGRHERIQAELGWPLWLAYAEDHIFESLPNDLSNTWPRRLAEAIPVGVTVPDLVLAKLLRWILLDDQFGAVHATDTESVKATVRAMGALFDRTIGGDIVPESEWAAEAARAARATWAAEAAWAAWAAEAAWAARAAWAAEAARAARAARAAWAARAARAAEAAEAAEAARAARAARAAEAAEAAFYPALSDELLRLLRELR